MVKALVGADVGVARKINAHRTDDFIPLKCRKIERPLIERILDTPTRVVRI